MAKMATHHTVDFAHKEHMPTKGREDVKDVCDTEERYSGGLWEWAGRELQRETPTIACEFHAQLFHWSSDVFQ